MNNQTAPRECRPPAGSERGTLHLVDHPVAGLRLWRWDGVDLWAPTSIYCLPAHLAGMERFLWVRELHDHDAAGVNVALDEIPPHFNALHPAWQSEIVELRMAAHPAPIWRIEAGRRGLPQAPAFFWWPRLLSLVSMVLALIIVVAKLAVNGLACN